jgi:hypothetical protein
MNKLWTMLDLTAPTSSALQVLRCGFNIKKINPFRKKKALEKIRYQ